VASACATTAPGGGQRQLLEVGRVDGLAGLGEGLAGCEVRGDRGEDVAPVEGRRDGLEAVARVGHVHRFDDAAEALGSRSQQAVVGPDEQPAVGEP